MAKRRTASFETRLLGFVLEAIGSILLAPFRVADKSKSSNLMSKNGQLSVSDLEKVNQQWREVGELMHLNGSSHFRMAILQADNIVDFVLKGFGAAGQTMGERLRNARGYFSPDIYDCVWKAHRIRNRLAHEADAEVMRWEAREALSAFEAALRQLGTIKD